MENIETTMDKLKLHSPDFIEQNIAWVADRFPSCITESVGDDGKVRKSVDFEQLRQELSESVVDGARERYHLDWPGKKEALLAANAPVAKTLRPCREESVSFEETKNLFIEGDNLDALKLLQETYLNKVKMIYIDPPYNTGNDFIYNDDYREDRDSFLERSEQVDTSGNRLVLNSDANGRFHSDWLSMMYPRLRLARNLLCDNGAIFISIDDHEVGSLRKICDEIFGGENFVATVIWQKVFSPKNTASHFSEDHDYILIYAKDRQIWRPQLLPRSAEITSRYTNPDDDPRGPWLSGAIQARNYYSKGEYEVVSPAGNKYSNPKGTYWRFSEAKFKELDRDNRIWWGKDGGGVPRLKRFLSEVKSGVVPQTLWKYELVGHTQEAKEELLKYVEFDESENILNSVKPSRLLMHAIKIGTSPENNDIVLDFFAGSGPTAQAVLQQNQEDGGNRRFILVQIAEKLPKPEEHVETIADLAKSRIRNVAKALSSNESDQLTLTENELVDCGFRQLLVDSSNMKDVYYAPDGVKQGDLLDQIENIKEDRTPEDLLFQVLLDWGVELSLPIAEETNDGKTVFFVDDNALAACFDKDIHEELVKTLAARKPLRAVFRDSGYGDDSVKINVEQIFKLISPSTEVKSI